MAEKFDLETSTPRHPYRVPDNFFASLEADILQRTVESAPARSTRRRRSLPRLILHWAATASAAAAIAGGVYFGFHVASPSEAVSVEQAFGELSDSDQQYLLDIYSTTQMRESFYASN